MMDRIYASKMWTKVHTVIPHIYEWVKEGDILLIPRFTRLG